VLPLLRDVAGLSVEVHTTARKHHATQIVRDLQNIDKVGERRQGVQSAPPALLGNHDSKSAQPSPTQKGGIEAPFLNCTSEVTQ